MERVFYFLVFIVYSGFAFSQVACKVPPQTHVDIVKQASLLDGTQMTGDAGGICAADLAIIIAGKSAYDLSIFTPVLVSVSDDQESSTSGRFICEKTTYYGGTDYIQAPYIIIESTSKFCLEGYTMSADELGNEICIKDDPACSIACPGQQTRDPVTGNCADPVCPAGQQLEPVTHVCRNIMPTPTSCPAGQIDLAPDIDGAQCGPPPQCSAGFHNSPETGLCVPDGSACIANGVMTCKKDDSDPRPQCMWGFVPDLDNPVGCIPGDSAHCQDTATMRCPDNNSTPPDQCSPGFIPDPTGAPGCVPANGSACVASATMKCPDPPPPPKEPPVECPAGYTLDVFTNSCTTLRGPNSCPPGWSFVSVDNSSMIGHCFPPQQPTCPTGYTYDPLKGCVDGNAKAPPVCYAGYYFDPVTQTCQLYQQPKCDSAHYFDAQTNSCLPLPGTPTCPDGEYYSDITKSCQPGQPPIKCDPGYTYDSNAHGCVYTAGGAPNPGGGDGQGPGDPATNAKLEELRQELLKLQQAQGSGSGGEYKRPTFLDAPGIDSSTDHFIDHVKTRPFFQQVQQIRDVMIYPSGCPLTLHIDLTDAGFGNHQTTFICDMLEAARPYIRLAAHFVYGWTAIMIFMTA